jgi:hypothetical protein
LLLRLSATTSAASTLLLRSLLYYLRLRLSLLAPSLSTVLCGLSLLAHRLANSFALRSLLRASALGLRCACLWRPHRLRRCSRRLSSLFLSLLSDKLSHLFASLFVTASGLSRKSIYLLLALLVCAACCSRLFAPGLTTLIRLLGDRLLAVVLELQLLLALFLRHSLKA